MAITGSIFGLNTVYQKQVQNIIDDNLNNWPEISAYGYFVGGSPDSSTVTRLDFSNNTFYEPLNKASLTTSRKSSFSNSSFGYYANGVVPTPANLSSTERLDYSTEISVDSGSNFPAELYGSAICQDDLNAFNSGGFTTTDTSQISKFEFSTETISLPGSNLPANSTYHAPTQSNNYGYFAGGAAPPATGAAFSYVLKLDFSTETLDNPGNNFPSVRTLVTSTQSPGRGYGYFCGGQLPPASPPSLPISSVERLDFSNDTLQGLTDLSTTLYEASAVSGQNYGYMIGGVSPASPDDTVLRSIDFDTEVVSVNPTGYNPSTVLTYLGEGTASARKSTRKNSYGSVGYSVGGRVELAPSPTYISCQVARLDISSESWSTTSSPLSYIFEGNSRMHSTNDYGYLLGHISANTRKSNKTRLDFSNETIKTPSDYLNLKRQSYGMVQNSFYGYLIAGDSFPLSPSPYLSSVERMDFSNESTSNISSNTPAQRAYLGSIESNTHGYVVGGVQPVSTPVYISTIDKLDFSTESFTTVPNGIHPVGKRSQAGSGTPSYGYFVGGYSYPVTDTYYSTISKFEFSTETQSNSPTNLNRSCSGISAIETPANAYYTGGGAAPNYYSTMTKFNFSTETVSDSSSVGNRAGAGGFKNSN